MMIQKSKNLLVTVPHLSAQGGVSSFWNTLLNEFHTFKDIEVEALEIGGHGKNILAPLKEQWIFHQKLNLNIDLAILNPSLLIKSFFRDGLFAKQLIKKKIPFMVFFHGWDSDFEQKVDKHYVSFFLNSFGHATKIVTLSPQFKERILEWGYKGEVMVETTMVERSLLKSFSFEQKKAQQIVSKTIKILFLARIEKEKGIFELLQAFQRLEHKIENIELIIAGEGEAFDALKQKVAHAKNIQLTGFVQGEEKIKLFEECDLYCLPSYSEGLPISVLEAMAFGLPIITSKVGGLQYFFQEDKMGHMLTPKDIDGLEERLEELLSNKDKRFELGEFNFHYVQQHLLSDVVAQRIYTQIKELIHEP